MPDKPAKPSRLHFWHLPFQWKIAIFFFMVVIILVSLFIVVQRSSKYANQTTRAVHHTYGVMLQNQHLLNLVRDLESGTTRYLLTGKEELLTPYHAARARLPAEAVRLRELTKDNPRQQATLDSVESLLERNMEVRSLLIAARRHVGADTAGRIYNTGITIHLIEELRSALNKLQLEEQRLLKLRETENRISLQEASTAITVFCFSIFLLLLAAGVLIYRNTAARNKAKREIDELNETLEIRIQEKTQEVIQKEQQYRFLLQNMREGIQVISYDWRYLFVNNAVVAQGKYSNEELLGNTMMEMYPGIEHTELYSVLQRCMKERAAQVFENEFSFPDGTKEWFELSIQPVPEGLFILSMDITTRKAGEQELSRLNLDLEARAAELLESNKELERFAYVASHDLQEPLRMVSSFLHLLEKKLEGTLDESARQYIHYAVDGSERMKKLIQDLLAYSRVGNSKDAVVAVDTNEVVNIVRSLQDLRIRESNATIIVPKLPVIMGVPALIQQLFQNLIGNALKYNTAAKPVIEIGCEDKQSVWQFYVRDNGIGIDPKFFSKIFVIFQRLHNKTEYSGTGIGLAICKKIIDLHGGSIWLDSTPGQGSTFHFTIPKNQ
jgi:PAS domain S-box-containing protein